MVGDRPLRAGDSAIESVEVGTVLSTAVLLPADMNQMAKLHEYENFALMMQHSILAIQHTHSYAVKAELIKKDLIAQGKAEAKAEEAESAAEAAKAKAKAKVAEVKVVEAEEKLMETLDNKEAEIKATDEKAYAESQADAEVEDKVEAATEVKVDAMAKSPTLNDQVLDLIGENEDEVPKSASPKKTTSEAEVQAVEKSLEETLLEIDAKIQADKSAQLTAEVETLSIIEARQFEENIRDSCT
ncbi:uncharacterized protein LOC114299907 [Camellia sinensis]|uniref:uncharacterized protein LOC114299907 n=1 Tax=Camellia sinensis TaxID=4442 RepID=UPI0010368244|nr:uncharacterized protein LOC114299907 [Camellia sinensis]